MKNFGLVIVAWLASLTGVALGQAFEYTFEYSARGFTVRYGGLNETDGDDRFRIQVTAARSNGYVAFGVSPSTQGMGNLRGLAGYINNQGVSGLTMFRTEDTNPITSVVLGVEDASIKVEGQRMVLEFVASSLNGRTILTESTIAFGVAHGPWNGDFEEHTSSLLVPHKFVIGPIVTESPTFAPTFAPTVTQNITEAPMPEPAFTGSKSIFNGIGTFHWKVESLGESTGTRRALEEQLGIHGRVVLDKNRLDGQNRWIGVMVGANMLGANVLLGLPALGMFPGQTQRQVAEYQIPTGISKLEAALEIQPLPASSTRLLEGSYVVDGSNLILEFKASGIGMFEFELEEKNFVTFVLGDGTDFSDHQRYETYNVQWQAGSAGSEEPSSSTLAYVVHGMLMVFAFLFVFPVAASTSVFRSHLGEWFPLHRWVNVSGILFVWASFIVILVQTGGLGSSAHSSLGLTLVIAVTLQATFAVFFRKGKTRPYWRASHFGLAFFIFLGGIINTFTGLELGQAYLRGESSLTLIEAFSYIGTALTCIITLIVAYNRWKNPQDPESKQIVPEKNGDP